MFYFRVKDYDPKYDLKYYRFGLISPHVFKAMMYNGWEGSQDEVLSPTQTGQQAPIRLFTFSCLF